MSAPVKTRTGAVSVAARAGAAGGEEQGGESGGKEALHTGCMERFPGAWQEEQGSDSEIPSPLRNGRRPA